MGFDIKNAMGGAASGASAGSIGGGWGMAVGGVAGGLLGGFFGGKDDDDDDYSKDFGQVGDEYEKYMREGLGEIHGHEAQGRGDLADYLKQSQAFTEPYRQGGASALQSYLGSMGLGGATGRQSALEAFHTSPSYQFALNQGLQGVQRNAAATGGRGSGAEQKALTSYATNLANQEYGQWQQGLSGLTNMGERTSENAAQRAYGTGGRLAELGLGYSGQISETYQGIAKAKSEALMAQAQAKAKQASDKSGAMSALGGLF